MLTRDDVVGAVCVLMGINTAQASGTAYASLDASTDDKNPLSYIQKMVELAVARFFGVLAESPLAGDQFLFALTTTAQSNTGHYVLEPGAVASSKIPGSILGVEISFGGSSAYRYAEPDSATAIRARNALLTAGVLVGSQYSYEIVNKNLYHTADGSNTYVRITYVPDPATLLGDGTTAAIPEKYAFPVICETCRLTATYMQTSAGIAAGAYYGNEADKAYAVMKQGQTDFGEIVPYQGG